MAMSYKARRRWSVLILLLGLPAYIVTAITIINVLGRPGMLLELLVYIVLGVVWALPFKKIFQGIGQANTDQEPK
jgi:hypothetical protein